MRDEPILEYHELPRREIERLARLEEREACEAACERVEESYACMGEGGEAAFRCRLAIRARGSAA